MTVLVQYILKPKFYNHKKISNYKHCIYSHCYDVQAHLSQVIWLQISLMMHADNVTKKHLEFLRISCMAL
jgi:hypothetical protein